MTNRIYSCKDVDMLMASLTIMKSFKTNLADLGLIRSNWTDTYESDLSTRIQNAIDNYLGLDKKGEQRKATLLLHSIQEPAQKALSFLKTQIEVDFKINADEILQTLGYTSNWKTARTDDQEALIQLLYAFKKGMTDALKTELTGKGTNPTLIENIIGYAAQLEEANVNQEILKQTSKELTEEAVVELNAIYLQIIGICKIASKYYENQPTLANQFTFIRVVDNMHSEEAKNNNNLPDV